MSRLVLANANVVDGINPSVAGQTVVIDGERITSVGTAPIPAQDGDHVIDLAGKSVMPGMALCHFHSTYANVGLGAPYGCEYPPSYQALVSHKNLMCALTHGFTTIVSAGATRDIEPGVKQAIEEGLLPGPRLTAAGRELSTTGHANEAGTPWHWNLPELGAARSCDGPDGFRFAVRDEVKKGVEIIKLFATGGHGVPGSKDRMEMTREEFAAAIDTAHSRGVLARGHLAGKKPIMTAIELGIDIVDHCDDMDDEVIAALAETGTFVVPSVVYPKAISGLMEQFQPGSSQGINESLAFMYDALPKAQAAGVRILLGDDYGGPGLNHGEYGKELHTYVEDVGMPPLTVIGWATRNAAVLLDRADDLGAVEPGKIADLLIVERDPSIDISAVADAPPIAVIKGGELIVGTLEAA